MGFSFFEALEHVSFGSAGFQEWMTRLLTRYLCTMEVIFLKRTCRRMREIVDTVYKKELLQLNLQQCAEKGTISIYEYLKKNGSWGGWWRRDRNLDPGDTSLDKTLWLFNNFLITQEHVIGNAIEYGDVRTVEYVLKEKWVKPVDCVEMFEYADSLELFMVITKYLPLDETETQVLFSDDLIWYRALRSPYFLGWVLRHQHLEFWNLNRIVQRSTLLDEKAILQLLRGASNNPDDMQREMMIVMLCRLQGSTCARDLFENSDQVCTDLGPEMMQFVEYDECCCENPENHRIKKRKI